MAKAFKYLIGAIILPLNLLAQVTTSLSLNSGVEINSLSWSIAGNVEGKNPNVLSELKFKNLTRLGSQLAGEIEISKLKLDAAIGFYKTLYGNGTDIDYKEDNRQTQSYSLNFKSNFGHSENLGIQAVYKTFTTKHTYLAIGGSYSYRMQKYTLHSDEHTDLNSIYKIKLNSYGPSVHVGYTPSKDLRLIYIVSFSKLNYSADADWNLFENYQHPRSFSHSANGYSFHNTLEFSKSIYTYFDLFLLTGLRVDNTRKGVDQLFYKSGAIDITQFNGANLAAFNMALGCKFYLN
ncbi:hypothetical protein [Sphingobacterium sp.]|uniref:hypothetical protein n=1 Tax=Sphingobacterium sp. TaxID=341027 RepID=UPI00289B097F|nr:hypothetical protein [Sphingobacterium sp.]